MEWDTYDHSYPNQYAKRFVESPNFSLHMIFCYSVQTAAEEVTDEWWRAAHTREVWIGYKNQCPAIQKLTVHALSIRLHSMDSRTEHNLHHCCFSVNFFVTGHRAMNSKWANSNIWIWCKNMARVIAYVRYRLNKVWKFCSWYYI